MICQPCREPHDPPDCIDSKAGREYPWRHCACQHHPLRDDHKHPMPPLTKEEL